MNNLEVVTGMQQKTNQEIREKIGIDLGRYGNECEIQLSEDNKSIKDTRLTMRLTVGEMKGIVNKFGDEAEKQNINKITKNLEFFHEMDEYEYPELVNKEVLKTPIAKVTSNSKGDMNVECLSGRIEDKRGLFKFDNAINQTVNYINRSITESHKNVINAEKDTIHQEGQSPVSQDREQARRQYIMRQMGGRDY